MTNKYVLITAAKDEEACIANVIEMVLRQTVQPVAWFIIDDGSSDQTASIVQQFAETYSFIKLYSSKSRGGRNFGSQYKAIQAAYDLAKAFDFEVIAVLDADTAPERVDYFESILNEFKKDPMLGMVSGFIFECSGGTWECRRDNSEDSTAGSGVAFRKICFEEIGGYTPLLYGGSDWLAQIDARVKGWKIKTRPDLHILHYRPTSSVGGILRGKFRAGLMDASFGSHPLFEIFKCARRATNPPFLLGGLIRFAGYLWWWITRRKPLISPEKVEFLRSQQLAKLHRWAVSLASGNGFQRQKIS